MKSNREFEKNYKKVKKGGELVMTIACLGSILMTVLYFSLPGFLGLFDIILSAIYFAILVILGKRISLVKYVETNRYINFILWYIIIISILGFILTRSGMGILDMILLWVLLRTSKAMKELMKNEEFKKTLVKDDLFDFKEESVSLDS